MLIWRDANPPRLALFISIAFRPLASAPAPSDPLEHEFVLLQFARVTGRFLGRS